MRLLAFQFGGKAGIRTPGGLHHTTFPMLHLRPLGHLSVYLLSHLSALNFLLEIGQTFRANIKINQLHYNSKATHYQGFATIPRSKRLQSFQCCLDHPFDSRSFSCFTIEYTIFHRCPLSSTGNRANIRGKHQKDIEPTEPRTPHEPKTFPDSMLKHPTAFPVLHLTTTRTSLQA